MPTAKLLTALATTLALVACTETDSASMSAPMPSSPMPAAPDGPPFITTMSPDASNAAVSACQSALTAQTEGGVTVVGSETSEAATAIYMRVGANGAPWRCLVAPDGSNPELMFMGDEGAA